MGNAKDSCTFGWRFTGPGAKTLYAVAMQRSYLVFLVTAMGFVMASCAYRIGSPDRSLPGGYRQVFVPLFKNRSMEPGIEVAFTNSLIQEFERAKIGRVSEENRAEVLLEGEIESVTYTPGGKIEYSEDGRKDLPVGAVMASSYTILILARINLVRSSDHSVLWSGSFRGERPYNSPQVLTAGVSSVNPLYNLSARRLAIDTIASSMMSEAHDRMTENF